MRLIQKGKALAILVLLGGLVACKQAHNTQTQTFSPPASPLGEGVTKTNRYQVTWEACSPAIVEPSTNANGCVSETTLVYGINGNPPNQAQLVENASLVRPPETDLYSVGIESGGCGDVPDDKGVYEVGKIAIQEGSEPPTISLKNVQPSAESTKSNPGEGMVVGGSSCLRL